VGVGGSRAVEGNTLAGFGVWVESFTLHPPPHRLASVRSLPRPKVSKRKKRPTLDLTRGPFGPLWVLCAFGLGLGGVWVGWSFGRFPYETRARVFLVPPYSLGWFYFTIRSLRRAWFSFSNGVLGLTGGGEWVVVVSGWWVVGGGWMWRGDTRTFS
jgi:hypothetical protein